MNPPQTSTDWRSVGMVALGACSFTTLIIFTRAISGMDAISIAFYRIGFAFLFFCLLLRRFPEARCYDQYRRWTGWLIGLGAAMGIAAILYIYAVQHTTAANAALLTNASPIYVALLGPIFLKEARPRYTVPALVMAVVGAVLITDPAKIRLESSAFSGILAATISGISFSVVLLLGRYLNGRVSGFTQVLWASGTVALVLLLPFGLPSLPQAIPNLHLLILLGIFSLGLPYLLYFTALKSLKAQVVSIVALLEPVSGVLIGLLILGEPLTLIGVIGSVLIVASIYVISQ